MDIILIKTIKKVETKLWQTISCVSASTHYHDMKTELI